MVAVQVTPVGVSVMVRATSGSITGSWTAGTGSLPRLAGNVLVAVVTAGGTTASAAAISTPSGWTQQKVISNVATTANTWAAVYTKTAAGSDSAPAFTATLSGTVAMTCTLLELAAANTLAPVDAVGTYSSGGTAGTLSSMAVTASSTVSQAGDYSLAVFVQEATAATNTWNSGSGWTNLVTDGSTSSVLHTAIDYQANPTSGSDAAETGHWTTDTTAYGAAILVAFSPLAGALELYTNEGSTTISSGGTTAPAAGTPEVWTAASWSSFPAVSQTLTPRTRFHVADPVAPSELIEVVNTSTGLVIRGAEGTTPVSHSSGFAISNVATAGSLGAGQQVYNVRAYGAKGDGSTDDTAAIQAALTAAVNAGAGIVYFPEGVYLVSQTLTVTSNVVLLGAGASLVTIRAKSGSWSSQAQIGSYSGLGMLQVAGEASVSNITVRGITWDGNQAGVTALPSWVDVTYTCSPLMLWNVTGLIIENCQVINPIGYGIYCANLTNFHIDRNTVTTGQATTWGLPSGTYGTPAQQDGIHIGPVVQGTVNGNTIDTGTNGAGDDGIAIQSLGVCHDLQISGNSIRANQAGIDLALSGYNIYNVAITGNTIWETQQNGIVSQPFSGSGAYSENITVSGNTILNSCAGGASGVAAIAFLDYSTFGLTPAAAWSNVAITGNTIQGITSANAYGIYARYGTGVTVAGNSISAFQGLVGLGIGDNVAGSSLPVSKFVVSSNMVDVSSSTVSGNVGVLLYDSGSGAVTSNTIIGPGANSSDRVGICPVQASATNLVQVFNATNNTLIGWDYGIQETNAGGGNPDYNSYADNLFSSCTTNISTLGTHSLIPDVEQYVALSSSYTLTSSTSAQKLFNATTNGALTVQGSTTYFFECEFDLTGMSTSTGTFSFGFGGTATFTSVKYQASAQKTATAGTLATWPSFVVTSASATALVATSVTTTGAAILRGILRVNGGGTIIPQVSVSTVTGSVTPVVSANSYFRIWPTAGSNTVTSIGNWS